jgi:hypothetical protein
VRQRAQFSHERHVIANTPILAASLPHVWLEPRWDATSVVTGGL